MEVCLSSANNSPLYFINMDKKLFILFYSVWTQSKDNIVLQS